RAGLQLGNRGSHVTAQVVDLTTYDRVYGRTSAIEGYERRLHVQNRIQQQASGEEYGTETRMGDVELAVVSLHKGDKFPQVLGRKIFPRYDQRCKPADHANRFEVDIRFVREVRIESHRRGVGSHLAHFDGVAIRIGAHGPGGAERAAGSNDILDDDL